MENCLYIYIDGLPIKNGDFPWQTVSHNQMVPIFDPQQMKDPRDLTPKPWISLSFSIMLATQQET